MNPAGHFSGRAAPLASGAAGPRKLHRIGQRVAGRCETGVRDTRVQSSL